jgi:hypothetical protein
MGNTGGMRVEDAEEVRSSQVRLAATVSAPCSLGRCFKGECALERP